MTACKMVAYSLYMYTILYLPQVFCIKHLRKLLLAVANPWQNVRGHLALWTFTSVLSH